MKLLPLLSASLFLFAVRSMPSQATPPSVGTHSAKPTPAEIAQSDRAFTPYDANNPNLLRDYDATEPLPMTDSVTIRRDIRELDASQLFAECPTDTAPYAFAESTNYWVQICSTEYDPTVPKYYMSRAKDGSGGLNITSNNETDARQLIFRNGEYTYIIYRDGARPQQLNAYLQIFQSQGESLKSWEEALLYLYEYQRLR